MRVLFGYLPSVPCLLEFEDMFDAFVARDANRDSSCGSNIFTDRF